MRFYLFSPRIRWLGGIRTGMSFDAKDLAKLKRPPVNPTKDAFLYVIEGDHGRCKIGITSNPAERLAQLATASAFPLRLAWVGVPKDDGAEIEREAHRMLDAYRVNGEWFSVRTDVAVGAISAAAHRCNQSLLSVTAEQAEQIRIRALREATRPTPDWLHRNRLWIAMILSCLIAWYIHEDGNYLAWSAMIGGLIGFVLFF